jgi:hypothetical protein
MKALPKEIQSICARIALEQSRQALSKWAQAMLALGKDVVLVNQPRLPCTPEPCA